WTKCPPHPKRSSCRALSPDGTTLALGTEGKKVLLWDLRTGEMRRSLDLSAHGNAMSLAFSPDGHTLACGVNIFDSSSDQGLVLSDVASAQPRPSSPLSRSSVSFVAFFPGGTVLATHTQEGKGLFWDLETGKPFKTTFTVGYGAPPSLSPDGTKMAFYSRQE